MFRRIIVGTAGLSGLFLAVPASAAPVEQVGCIADELGDTALSQLSEWMIAGKKRKVPNPVSGSLNLAADVCAKRFEWSKIEANNSMQFAIGKGVRELIAARLKDEGVKFEVLDAYVDKNYEYWKRVGFFEGLRGEELKQLGYASGAEPNYFNRGPFSDMVYYLMGTYLQRRALEAFEAGVLLETESLG